MALSGQCIHGSDDAVILNGRVRSLTCEHCNKLVTLAQEFEVHMRGGTSPTKDEFNAARSVTPVRG